ncbi:hypothetical protein BZA77DRAFT_45209 [Pyronema omphalodes]|nr:hypothetical protein BZA77DRAFT_45209 [Pyronema omphalodes]
MGLLLWRDPTAPGYVPDPPVATTDTTATSSSCPQTAPSSSTTQPALSTAVDTLASLAEILRASGRAQNDVVFLLSRQRRQRLEEAENRLLNAGREARAAENDAISNAATFGSGENDTADSSDTASNTATVGQSRDDLTTANTRHTASQATHPFSSDAIDSFQHLVNQIRHIGNLQDAFLTRDWTDVSTRLGFSEPEEPGPERIVVGTTEVESRNRVEELARLREREARLRGMQHRLDLLAEEMRLVHQFRAQERVDSFDAEADRVRTAQQERQSRTVRRLEEPRRPENAEPHSDHTFASRQESRESAERNLERRIDALQRNEERLRSTFIEAERNLERVYSSSQEQYLREARAIRNLELRETDIRETLEANRQLERNGQRAQEARAMRAAMLAARDAGEPGPEFPTGEISLTSSAIFDRTLSSVPPSAVILRTSEYTPGPNDTRAPSRTTVELPLSPRHRFARYVEVIDSAFGSRAPAPLPISAEGTTGTGTGTTTDTATNRDPMSTVGIPAAALTTRGVRAQRNILNPRIDYTLPSTNRRQRAYWDLIDSNITDGIGLNARVQRERRERNRERLEEMRGRFDGRDRAATQRELLEQATILREHAANMREQMENARERNGGQRTLARRAGETQEAWVRRVVGNMR